MRSRTRNQTSESECQVELPAKITSIQRQKKRNDRYSLYHQGQFITGVSVPTMMKFQLARGIEITDQRLSDIKAEEEHQALKAYMIRLLGRRDHSKKELIRKSIKKGYRQPVIDTILSDLESHNYIDDVEFARKFASDKIHIRQWGPEKIRAELYKKGISRSDANRILDDLSENLQLNHICVDLILKRKNHFLRQAEDKRKQKIIAYLQRKGFNFNTINRSLPDIFSKLHV